MNDYFPRSSAEQVTWLTNFNAKIVTSGVTLGLTAPEILDFQNYCTNLIAAINELETKRKEFKSAVEKKDKALQTEAGGLRTGIARFKTALGYAVSIGQELGVVGVASSMNMATYKAKITAELYGSFVRIKFTKKGTDGVNIYHRKKGESAWKFLARDTKSPYDDRIVLAIVGQPEHWEYRAFGVIDDAEIGIASDIVEIVFGG
jgi:hypothetical protein